ncbi:5-epiaristolochene 1,3-dihydroxylase [Platanthera guangdongensis]|uniref:5-epiaristolochene 1,3-dihydroxylase n=1 Tax=Platanthera guangdongensis TaxID=2320717 RepID=A0ABR2LZ26_9ASPA
MDLRIIITLFIFFLVTVFIKRLRRPRPKQPILRQPPGPWNLPVIGSLHHLLRPQPPHQILRRLSAVHGPIMRLKLGEIPAVVVSSSAAAKEILKTHDISFASRPISSSFNAICYGGKDIAFAPYGDFWRQMRRLCLLELFSAKRVQSFRYIREAEISNLILSIAEAAASGISVDLSHQLSLLSNNITSRAVVGGKTTDQKLFQSAVAAVVELASGFNVVDIFPSMPFIARITGITLNRSQFASIITGFKRKLEQCHRMLDHVNEEIIQQHKKKQGQLFAEEDITDVLLRIQADDNLQIPITNEHIKAVINDLLVAGTNTTATVIVWAMSELIRNVAEEELMSGDKLGYLKLVIKEAMRMHPPLPLLLPRENQEGCEVMGYEIPAKTTVMVNAWAVGRDASNWKDPDAFRPERFEGSAVDYKGGNMELIPFGGGRRICPGMSFGLAAVEMALAHMLYYFDWEYLTKRGEELDMTEAPGLAMERKFPLCLLPIQRFPLPTA